MPPENSVATRAMNVTKTRKPANEAPTANASVPPPLAGELGEGGAALSRVAMPVDFADANTVRVATTAKSSEPAIAISNVRRRTSRMSSALMMRVIVHLLARG